MESVVSRNQTLSLGVTPFEVKTSRPSAGFSHRSSEAGSDFSIGFDVVGSLNTIIENAGKNQQDLRLIRIGL